MLVSGSTGRVFICGGGTATLFLGLCRFGYGLGLVGSHFIAWLRLFLTSLSPESSTPVTSPPTLLSLRLPPGTGTGYVQSLPPASQDWHVVLTPLFTHLTLLRLHRTHAIDDLILCADPCPAGVWGVTNPRPVGSEDGVAAAWRSARNCGAASFPSSLGLFAGPLLVLSPEPE